VTTAQLNSSSNVVWSFSATASNYIYGLITANSVALTNRASAIEAGLIVLSNFANSATAALTNVINNNSVSLTNRAAAIDAGHIILSNFVNSATAALTNLINANSVNLTNRAVAIDAALVIVSNNLNSFTASLTNRILAVENGSVYTSNFVNSATTALSNYVAGVSGASGYIGSSGGLGTNTTINNITNRTLLSNLVALTVYVRTNQTSNSFELYDNTNKLLFYIGPDGTVTAPGFVSSAAGPSVITLRDGATGTNWLASPAIVTSNATWLIFSNGMRGIVAGFLWATNTAAKTNQLMIGAFGNGLLFNGTTLTTDPSFAFGSSSGLGTNAQVEGQLRFREGGIETYRMYSTATNFVLEDVLTPSTPFQLNYLAQSLSLIKLLTAGITNTGGYSGQQVNARIAPTNATASRVIVTDANGIVTNSVTTSAEVAFVNGVTSAIQTQLDARLTLAAGNIVSNTVNNKVAATNGAAYGLTLNGVTTNAGAFYNVQSNLVYTGTAGVTQTNVHIDFSFGNEFYLLLTNNAFLIPTNMRPAQVVNIEIWQDGTGSRSVAWQGTVSTNASGLALTNTANARNVITMKAGKYATNVFAVPQAGFQ
jgi:hypothetical protein